MHDSDNQVLRPRLAGFSRRAMPVLALCCGLWASGEAAMMNVVDHGADPTGKKDSTAILTRLHATGKRVHYPNGVYRFNGETLDLSGGLRFESMEGVTVRNDISRLSIIQFDDAGNLVGLIHNHLELDNTDLGGHVSVKVGALVRPPVSTAKHRTKVDLLAHWYNDFGLEHRRVYAPHRGWIGWYYWSWNFHDTTRDTYDPARHPLLGFYRGDDPIVLDWQCYWLREYGVAGVILMVGDLEGWEEADHRDHWIWRLFTDVPNFRGLEYVIGAPSRHARSTPENMAKVERQWRALIDRTYLRHRNFYSVRKGQAEYPLIFLFEEAGLRGVFDNYVGAKRTLAFYRRIAALFRSDGFAGIAVLGRHPIPSQFIDFDELEKQGVLHFNGFYAGDHSSGDTYAKRVANYSPPADPRTITNTFTAKHTHAPHPSKWHCPGHTPALFRKLLQKAVAHVHEQDMPRVITCYNVAEWAEGGPGLQPNMQDRFGYLEAVRDSVVIGDETEQ